MPISILLLDFLVSDWLGGCQPLLNLVMALEKAAGAAALVWRVEAVACWAGAVVAGVVGLDAICWLLSATTSDAAFLADLSTEIFARPGGALGGAGGLRHGKFSK